MIIFLFKLALSFLIGGTWVVGATIFADKLGSKVGGLIAGLPSTIIFGLLFLAWTQTPQAVVEATTIVPIVSGVSCLFILTYIYFIKKGVWIALFISLLIWFLLVLSLVILDFNNYFLSILGYVILLTFSYLIIEKKVRIKSLPGKKIIYTFPVILLRGLLSGSVIASAIIAARIGGPIWGGVFSTFPALFTSTMLVTYFSQGAEFSAATMKASMVSAISVVVYSMIVRLAYIPLGVLLGTVVSLFVSFLSGFLIYKVIVKKLK